MPAAQILQPVLKMKVDELFLHWLSETTTQSMLKDYLKLIESGETIDIGIGNATSEQTPNGSNNKNHSNSELNILGYSKSPFMTSKYCSSTPSQLASTLPSGTCTSPRNGLNARTRRSSGIKTVQAKKESLLPPTLSECIPKFYFPQGCPKKTFNVDAVIARIENAFVEFENEKATLEDMGKIAKACDCPLYWKSPLFCAAGGERTGYVSVHKFIAMWRKILQNCHDDVSKFVHLLSKPGCNYLEQDDFIPLIQDVVNAHPGLTFLREATEFHTRYVTTVIQRIFYTVNRSWTGRMTCTEIRKSNLLQNLALLEEEDDINQLTEFFSYEHFYVIYCKFWELDTDHDLYIDQKDLARHNDDAISSRMIERIFSGAVTRHKNTRKERKIGYADFVWFLISEEDKKTPTSIEYWFRCLDLDGDGVLSMYELDYFYEEQCKKLECMSIEPLPFEDCLCQLLDLVKPECEGKITLHDLKKCKMANIFFDTLFNIDKYLEHEQKDPFSIQRDVENEGPEMTDWERYAVNEYESLVAEEAANENWNDGDSELSDY
ncbi:serine/threonine-protein phosphatase 2A regulatory subunit B'' subunit beta-like isoform X2 [Amblyraja radiata]|uniref:serine/threonine-protein phosphatase 2A regulatory subunit B'' subunit beta-like isoform X2 n=1 Tax=Amblyraja radiata TaxID=386614 RepID=UPI001402E3CB|nr:serine/threonine-protein phosphatase 2A regulatory subunit B'' subunit beta-like isoform X2 [Amblyraja radiata]